MATATSSRDRLEELKDRIARILLGDAKKVRSAGKGVFFSIAELDAFLAMPDVAFPLVQRGVTFQNRAELQLARNAAEPGKALSASMKGSLDRIEAFTKGNLLGADRGTPTINVQRMYVAIPQPPQEAIASTERVLVLRRNAQGEVVRPLIEAEAVAK